MRTNKGAAGDIITIGILGGLAYYLYSSGMLDSIFRSFGGSAPAAPPAQTPVVQASVVPITQTPAAQSPPPCTPTGILAPLLANVQKASGAAGSTYGPNLPGVYTIDEWGYYLNQMCSGMADQYGLNADTLFPGAADRGGELNWSAFAGLATQRGFSGPPRRMVSRVARPGEINRIMPGSVIHMPMGTYLVRRGA